MLLKHYRVRVKIQTAGLDAFMLDQVKNKSFFVFQNNDQSFRPFGSLSQFKLENGWSARLTVDHHLTEEDLAELVIWPRLSFGCERIGEDDLVFEISDFHIQYFLLGN